MRVRNLVWRCGPQNKRPKRQTANIPRSSHVFASLRRGVRRDTALWHKILTHLFAEYRALGHPRPEGSEQEDLANLCQKMMQGELE